MLTLLQMLLQVLLHPSKTKILTISMTSGMFLVACGTRPQINEFSTLLSQRHNETLQKELAKKKNTGVDKPVVISDTREHD